MIVDIKIQGPLPLVSTLMLFVSIFQGSQCPVPDTISRKAIRHLMKVSVSKKLWLKGLTENDSSEDLVNEPNHQFADIGTKCNLEFYKLNSWVHYFGYDPYCEDSILMDKKERARSNASLFEALCHNPAKILECRMDTERCGCAKGPRWRVEQALTEQDGQCRLGDDADCDELSWAECVKGLECVSVGQDVEGNLVKRCRLPRKKAQLSSANSSSHTLTPYPSSAWLLLLILYTLLKEC